MIFACLYSKDLPKGFEAKESQKGWCQKWTLEDLLQQGHLEPIVQDHVQVFLEYLEG